MLERRRLLHVANIRLLIKKAGIAIFFLLITALHSYSQISIQRSTSVDQLMDQFVQMNMSEDNISGYRLQIIASDDRREVDKVRSRVRESHPEYRTIWKFSNPYYKVLAGAFRSKLEAERARYLVGQTYNNVLIVMDNEIPRTELAP